MVDDSLVVPVDDTQVVGRLNYVERSVAIMDSKTEDLRNKVVQSVAK